jgi:hypothetical protein
MDHLSPAQEYSDRLRSRELRVARFHTIHIRLGNVRLGLAIIAFILGWISLARHAISVWWLAAPLAVFMVVADYHTKVLRRLSFAERSVKFYQKGIARIEDRWHGSGETGQRFRDPRHIYEADLDIFGEDSLFALLSTARTRIGEETLARWLLGPSPLKIILDRHVAIAELRQLLDFREDMAVAGEDARVGIRPAQLAQWAESPQQMRPAWLRIVASLLAVLAAASVVVWAFWGTSLPFFAVVVIESGIVYFFRSKIEDVLHKTEHAFEDLGLLSSLVERVEAEQFVAAPLNSLRRQFCSNSNSTKNFASRAIAQLRSITNRIYSRHNLFLRIIDVPLMYSVRLAFAADTWRHKYGHSVRQWLAAVGEIEALVALATYSYEHPADPFPQFTSGSACFAAEKLGHPLIPDSVCIRNNVEIGEHPSVLLISGSNMSGKSTLLRAVGINTVLAMAGAPVRARHMRMTPLRVGASIRINDSLQAGNSRFYAEITRLRKILDLTAGDFPVMFLFDEVLQGTNSHDRRVGTQGIVNGFLKRGAIGLLSTHDLALTEISGNRPDEIKNMHFQDELKDGRMCFDYILRDGIVSRSNGLALMRSIGLDV